MTDWNDHITSSLDALKGVEAIYRPTNFWGPALDQLLSDLDTRGLETFKSWPSSKVWFYSTYGAGFSNATIAQVFETSSKVNPSASKNWVAGSLNGSYEARRDYDVACAFWDQGRWPTDLHDLGESTTGKPPQAYRLSPNQGVAYGRAYLHYLLCLSALSRHVDVPPRSFLEIGGGFGVLGEIVLARDPEARYVDLDIPPVLTIASYYLTELFGADRVATLGDVPSTGTLELSGSAVLPNWRISDVQGQFDVFVNCYSFQEMEPEVVEHYVSAVADKGVTYAVSLNSRLGKPKAQEAGEWGALEPVRSADIVAMFEKRGYDLVAQHDEPVVRTAAQLCILKRR